MKSGLYSPRVYDAHIKPLYRLARVRGVPMTRLLNDAVASLIAAAEDEIAEYQPVVHDRRPRCHSCGRSHDRPENDRPGTPCPAGAPAAVRRAA